MAKQRKRTDPQQNLTPDQQGDTVYRVVDVVGVSETSWEDAGLLPLRHDAFQPNLPGDRTVIEFQTLADRRRSSSIRSKGASPTLS
jgi:hypothetical protein